MVGVSTEMSMSCIPISGLSPYAVAMLSPVEVSEVPLCNRLFTVA
jgi:hypothetical protein